MPVPSSNFISAAQRLLSQTGQQGHSTIRQGEMAHRLDQMKQSRAHDLEIRRTKILEAKYEAQLKRQDEADKRKLEME
jgi:hypothetical protein